MDITKNIKLLKALENTPAFEESIYLFKPEFKAKL